MKSQIPICSSKGRVYGDRAVGYCWRSAEVRNDRVEQRCQLASMMLDDTGGGQVRSRWRINSPRVTAPVPWWDERPRTLKSVNGKRQSGYIGPMALASLSRRVDGPLPSQLAMRRSSRPTS